MTFAAIAVVCATVAGYANSGETQVNKEYTISNARVNHARFAAGGWRTALADAPEGSTIATVAAAFAVAAEDFAFDVPGCGVSCEKGQLAPLLQVPCGKNLHGTVAFGPGLSGVSLAFGFGFGFGLGLGFGFGS